MQGADVFPLAVSDVWLADSHFLGQTTCHTFTAYLMGINLNVPAHAECVTAASRLKMRQYATLQMSGRVCMV